MITHKNWRTQMKNNEYMLIYHQSFIGIKWLIPLVRVTNWLTATIVLNIREIAHNNVWMTWGVFFLVGHLISCPPSPSLCNSNKYERTRDPFSDGYQQITGLKGILLMFLWSLSWVLFNHYSSCCSHLVIDHGVRYLRWEYFFFTCGNNSWEGLVERYCK